MYVTEEDFDKSNEKMKEVHFSEHAKKFSEGEIWWCTLGINIGVEQNGTGIGMRRPVVILKKLTRKSCYVIPLTTSRLDEEFRISIGKVENEPAKAMFGQIRMVDSKRLSKKITTIDPCMFLYIREIARKLF